MYLLGIDIGTSAIKAALFDAQGALIRQVTGTYDVHYPQRGWAQQNPDDWWAAACRSIRLLTEDIDSGLIAGVGVDGQSWSAILIDDQGEVLLETPIWMDTRAEAECRAIDETLGAQRLFALCGNPTKPSYALPKLLWYRNHRPDAYRRAACVLQSNSFIVHRLTGALSQDVSQGYGFQVFDMRRNAWDYGAIEALGLRQSLFPPIFECADVVGHVSAHAARLTGLMAGTPVVAGGLDAACGTLGAGVIDDGQAQEQGGQAGGVSLCLERYAANPRLILSRHVVPGRWLLQGGTVGGGGTLKWMKDQFFPGLSFEQMSDLAAEAPPGSDGLMFLPYMAGERSPIWNPNATGVFYGLGFSKTAAHMVRAAMEGVAYSLRHNLEVAAESGAAVGTMNAMGGSANSRVWTQIKADVTGHILQVPASDTATTWGAAMLAGVGTGAMPGFKQVMADTLSIRRVHTPNADNRDIYDAGYARYRELYDRLEPMMKG